MKWLPALLFLLLFVPSVRAETVYRGEQTLWQDTVWQGEVLIDGILTVAPEVRLEIRPGTTVRFTFYDSNGDGIGEHEMFVQGRIVALGSAERPIRFTAAGDNLFPGAWGAVNMMGSDAENLFRHCVVEYGAMGFHSHFGRARIDHSLFRRNLRGLMFQDSTVNLLDCRIEDNFNGLQFRDSTVVLRSCVVTGGNWAVRCVYSTLEMVGCRIENNRVNGVNLRDSTLTARGNLIRGNRSGIYVQGGEAELTGNLVSDNLEHGTLFENAIVMVKKNRIIRNGRAGVRWIDARGELSGNDLSGNLEYAFVNDGRQDARLGSNWWGTADPARIAELIRDRRERDDVGAVIFAPPLTAPPAIEAATGRHSTVSE
ncbi:parallel beta helix pectate lyase-like protein [Geothermobacter ehrlichii]|uniref:Parallel beta helix pectate lyase-like protein n=1 Tax=Geothermobacter ehrlichii TaxID=213224 RepID=A0A5D3WQ69_9BACT|nr:right-handed parallel beta-helix repeat-containing protein [Geothermobacter ehrlichii]TYO99620.1 parallel beta helix pectate lyase-like protein [Geothermobacter ehrlichii]